MECFKSKQIFKTFHVVSLVSFAILSQTGESEWRNLVSLSCLWLIVKVKYLIYKLLWTLTVAIFAYVSQDKVNFLMIPLIVLVTLPWWRLGHDRLRETEKSELSSVSVAQSTKAFRSCMLFVGLKFSCWRIKNACIFNLCILLEMMKRGKWFQFCQPWLLGIFESQKQCL